MLFAGPSLGFKLRAKATVGFRRREDVTDDIGDDIESFDYGVVFGAGWEAGRFSIDGRYTWGLSASASMKTTSKTTHRVIAVLAGVRF